MTLVNLENFCNTLDKFYNHLSSPQYISNKEEKEYLYNAYINIEKFWYQNFNLINKLNFVLIGEAPLYKDGESYFYNPNSGATNFFNYKNCIDIFGELKSPSKIINGKRVRKHEMLEKLRDNGLLILDLFPFCFAKDYTQINYRQLRKRDLIFLFSLIKKSFLKEKLNDIYKKNPSVSFGFRYAANKKKIGLQIENITREIGFTNWENIQSFHKNRDLNSKLITKLF